MSFKHLVVLVVLLFCATIVSAQEPCCTIDTVTTIEDDGAMRVNATVTWDGGTETGWNIVEENSSGTFQEWTGWQGESGTHEFRNWFPEQEFDVRLHVGETPGTDYGDPDCEDTVVPPKRGGKSNDDKHTPVAPIIHKHYEWIVPAVMVGRSVLLDGWLELSVEDRGDHGVVNIPANFLGIHTMLIEGEVLVHFEGTAVPYSGISMQLVVEVVEV